MFATSASVGSAAKTEHYRLLPSPHKKINELETRSASLTACYREPIRPRLLLVWSMLIAGSCGSHAHGNPVYSVTGLAVGSRVQFDSEAYHEYRCGPSFDSLTFCVKTTSTGRCLQRTSRAEPRAGNGIRPASLMPPTEPLPQQREYNGGSDA